jgi:HSP20 family molecular chaperone IbpA
LARAGTGFEDFYNMIDDFFNDGVLAVTVPKDIKTSSSRKIDIE